MLPPSVTSWPRASRWASRPATRTAEGPMSTPRRDAPRSSGTPRMWILRGGRACTPLLMGPMEEPVTAAFSWASTSLIFDMQLPDCFLELFLRTLWINRIQRVYGTNHNAVDGDITWRYR